MYWFDFVDVVHIAADTAVGITDHIAVDTVAGIVADPKADTAVLMNRSICRSPRR